ncbi:YhzD family protein [Peribacillus sp. B-H-3]|uniref:YhzD family protein n=1 Tax=Peribacillus sp. B-H-3 TaxID=3400420 RepID=UPI003B019190
MMMGKVYKVTAFAASGEKLLDESISAENDQQAKISGESLLKEKKLLEQTHRCTSPTGKLILFHR